MRVLLVVLLAVAALTSTAAGDMPPDTASLHPRSKLDPSAANAAGPFTLHAPAATAAWDLAPDEAAIDAYGLLTSSRIPAGTRLTDVAIGYLDADAFPDIVATGMSGSLSAVIFLWNDGAGGFASSTVVVPPSFPRGLAVRDLDLDGDADVVISEDGAPNEGDALNVLENLGARNFAQHVQPMRVGPGTLRPVLVDVTGDGLLDIVVPCQGSDLLWVAHGLGGIAFEAPRGVPAGRYGIEVAAGDVDGDGQAEVFLAFDDCNSITMFRGGPAGLSPVGEVGFRWGASGVALADVAGDAAPDLVVGTTHGTFTLLENVGGAFPAWIDVATVGLSRQPIAVDIDGDGAAEVVGAGFDTDAINVLSRLSVGYESRSWGVGMQPAAVAAGDLDGDGRTDIATVQYLGDFVTVAWGDGGPSLRTTREYDAGGRPFDAAAADLDGDGRLDIATVQGQWLPGSMSVLHGRAGGGFDAPVVRPTPANPYSVAAGDLNGDGYPELVTANHGADGISVFINDGAGGFPARTDITTAGRPFAVAIGDLDRDGYGDVAVANYQSGSISVLRGGGGTLVPSQTLSASAGPTGVLVADLDNDGDLDAAAACYDSEIVRLYRNDGTGSLAQVSALWCTGGPWRLATTTRPDLAYPLLLVACREESYVAVFSATGPFSFARAGTVTVGVNPSSVAAVDLDDDGLTELVASVAGTGVLSITRGTVSSFDGVSPYAASRWPERVLTGDFTGDGVIDLAVANERARTVSVFARRVALTPGVDAPGAGPSATTALGAPFPNPVRATARIPFTLGRAGPVRLALVDLAGRHVRVLADATLAAGAHAVSWDGRGDDARELPAGIYFCVMEAGERRTCRRLMVLR
jgi:hypothetical protein